MYFKISALDYAYCPDYNDECFGRYEPLGHANIVIRGCSMENKLEDSQNNATNENQTNIIIKTCSTPLCNDEQFMMENCIRCKNSQLNGSCYSELSADMYVSCQKLVTKTFGCFSAINLVSGNIVRDCVSDFPMETANNWDTFDMCQGKFCNSRDYSPMQMETNSIEKETKPEITSSEPVFDLEIEIDDENDSQIDYHWCLECEGRVNSECSVLADFTKFEKICNKTDQTNDQRGCFTWNNGKY